MNHRIYKLQFHSNLLYLDSIYSSLSDLDKQRLSTIDVLSSFHFDSQFKHFVYMIIQPKEIEFYKNILNINLIPYFCEDISESVLDNLLDLESELVKFCDMSNLQHYDNFIFELNSWILENLNLDSILDRINSDGINSLRPIDKEFLKRV
jgi:hypothetical protein